MSLATRPRPPRPRGLPLPRVERVPQSRKCPVRVLTRQWWPPSHVPSLQVRRRRYHENPQDIKKRKQSTPRKKKGIKPRTAAQALAEKEQAASNPRDRVRGDFKGGGDRGGFRGGEKPRSDGPGPNRR